MALQTMTKSDVQQILALLKSHLSARDKQVMDELAKSDAAKASTLEQVHSSLSIDLDEAIGFVDAENYHEGEAFHSRNRLAGLAQSHQNAASNPPSHNDVGDALPAVVNLFGEGNPIVWAPVMVNILLEHLKPKAEFITATDDRSYIRIPEKCTIALLGDWGADNDHAVRIAEQVRSAKPDYAVHLGDIYYAGSQYECERFLDNWPMDNKKNSFALNGNHEMYSRGIPFFKTVLPAFDQEASYFTLYNDIWQFHGLDTAYVPFSLDGSVPAPDHENLWNRLVGSIQHLIPGLGHEIEKREPDERLMSQWNWLLTKITANPQKRNVFFSHNQPVSAYLPEFQAGSFLYNEFWKLREAIPAGAKAIHAWFFGHEHKCTIYSDDKTQFRARLIGNGAIPHTRQALVAAAKDETNTSCTPVFTMNDRAVKHDALGIAKLDLAISGFALLAIDGPNISVRYINEDGSLFLEENLTGESNEVVSWGEGYGPLKN